MKKPWRQLPVFLLLLIITIMRPALAQEPWYEVELIVFLQADPGGPDRELHPVNPAPPRASQIVSLRSPQDGNVAYTMLSSAQLKLGNIVQGLKSSSYYEPLLHLGWRQPGLASKDAAAVALPADWQPWADTALPPLHGLVSLHQDRFIHIGIDLRYRPNRAHDDLEEQPTFVNKQSRRLRSGELHYLDRPGLGVLVQIRSLSN